MFTMIRSITLKKLRPKLPSVIRDIQVKMDRFIVTKRGVPVAIMIAPEDYESLVETLEVLSNRGLIERLIRAKKDAAVGHTKSLDQLTKELGIV
jgi:antitoxin YefM